MPALLRWPKLATALIIMSIKGFRLGSIVPDGFGGPEAGAIAFIYAQLLHQAGQHKYAISINQIGLELDEFIHKGPGKKIHINIRYPVVNNFNNKSLEEKNRKRLDIIHDSMLRIAEEFSEYDVAKIEEIKKTILEKNFSFEFKVKSFQHPKNRDLVAKIVVKPQMLSFEYFAVIEQNGVETKRVAFYSGLTTFHYLTLFFQKAKWQGENQLILTGRENIVETHIRFDEDRIEYINLTPYPKPPLFELMKVGITHEEKERYAKNWKHSLPPHIAGL